MNLYNETKNILKKYNIIAAKSLGQNFLIDDDAVEKILDASKTSKEDLIIEIGPGLGTLTSPLLEKAAKVICIELDKRMVEILKDRFFMYDNFEIINEDVLKVDLKELIKKEKMNNKGIKDIKIVANLPYYITTPIIMKLLEDRLDIESITVMIQKEVADRLVCKPGDKDSGAITYAINYYTIPERIVEVSNKAFIPAPEVNSSVIKLQVLNKPSVDVKNEQLLFRIIKLVFMQKRKTLLNGLTNGKLGSKENIENMLKSLEIDLKIRGEKLKLEDFARMADFVENNFKK